MSPLLLGAIGWVFAATATAFLPYRYQFVPGIALIGAALVLIWLIGQGYGWIPGLLALAAFLSFFRRPLAHLARWLVRKVRP